jgi:hypothetical protein
MNGRDLAVRAVGVMLAVGALLPAVGSILGGSFAAGLGSLTVAGLGVFLAVRGAS